MLVICKVLQHHQNYEINQCFLNFPDSDYEARFKDTLGPDNFSTLSSGAFWWLINMPESFGIPVGQLVLHRTISS